MTSLSSNLVEWIHKINVNMDMIIKNVKNMKLNTKIASATLYVSVKDDLIVSKCFCCNKNCQKKVWWRLKEAIY